MQSVSRNAFSMVKRIVKDLPVTYASIILNMAEELYSMIELVYLTIIFGIKQFKPYLYGRKLIILMIINHLLDYLI